jgi:hypothetical protein
VLEHAHAAHALEVVPLDEAAERFAALAPVAHRLIGNLHARVEFSAANGHGTPLSQKWTPTSPSLRRFCVRNWNMDTG